MAASDIGIQFAALQSAVDQVLANDPARPAVDGALAGAQQAIANIANQADQQIASLQQQVTNLQSQLAQAAQTQNQNQPPPPSTQVVTHNGISTGAALGIAAGALLLGAAATYALYESGTVRRRKR